MRRSTDRIITTQVGSLPRPNDLRKMWDDRLAGRPYDRDAFAARVKSAVAEMVEKQVECGVDVVSDGEQGRLGWTAFLPERLAGFEERPVSGPTGGGVTGRERQKGQFDGYLAERARLQAMGEGLYVTELMGMGINTVTGDYTRGAAGFWVESGVIQHAVEEITIAGNLRDMFLGIRSIGADQDRRGNVRTGSVLIDAMTVAGT